MNFEQIADRFQQYFQVGAISRCDVLEIETEEVRLVEQTSYGTDRKNLLENVAYQQELRENIKKMWGSSSVLVWYLMEQDQTAEMRKRRIFILETPLLDNRMFRPLRNMMYDLEKYRNGAYDEINFRIRD